MKNPKNNIVMHTIYNAKCDTMIAQRVPQIQEEIVTFARDLATQGRPKQQDSALLFLPKIKALFETFLEQLLRIIAAFSVLTEDGSRIKAQYKEELERLKVNREALEQDLRLVQKDAVGLIDLSHILKRWKFKWRPLLIALTVGEVAINFKIFLLVTPNLLVAGIASISLCVGLFVVAHSYKDILAYFTSKLVKRAVGSGILLGVVLLLYSINKIRLAYLVEIDPSATENLSESGYEFIMMNLVLFCAGVIIAVLYKPLKSTVAKHAVYKKIHNTINTLTGEIKTISDRIDLIPEKLAQKLEDIRQLQYMGKHYENEVVSEYLKTHSLFISENLFRRKDGITAPDAFLEKPPKLTTYFDHISVEPVKNILQ